MGVVLTESHSSLYLPIHLLIRSLLTHSQARLFLDVWAAKLGLVQAEHTLPAVIHDHAVGTFSTPTSALVLGNRSLDLVC